MAVADRDELWEARRSVSVYIVETDHVHNIYQSAKPGEAMPGPSSSLMVLRRCVSRSGPTRTGGPDSGRKTQINADAAIRLSFTSNKDSRTSVISCWLVFKNLSLSRTRRAAPRATVRSGSVS